MSCFERTVLGAMTNKCFRLHKCKHRRTIYYSPNENIAAEYYRLQGMNQPGCSQARVVLETGGRESAPHVNFRLVFL